MEVPACARASISYFFMPPGLLLLLLLLRREGHVPFFAALTAFLRDYVLTVYEKKTRNDNIKHII